MFFKIIQKLNGVVAKMFQPNKLFEITKRQSDLSIGWNRLSSNDCRSFILFIQSSARFIRSRMHRCVSKRKVGAEKGRRACVRCFVWNERAKDQTACPGNPTFTCVTHLLSVCCGCCLRNLNIDKEYRFRQILAISFQMILNITSASFGLDNTQSRSTAGQMCHLFQNSRQRLRPWIRSGQDQIVQHVWFELVRLGLNRLIQSLWWNSY